MAPPAPPPSRVFAELDLAPAPAPEGRVGLAALPGREVHVSGSAELSARPDRARVSLRLGSRKEAAVAARSSVSRRLQYITHSARLRGVPVSSAARGPLWRRGVHPGGGEGGQRAGQFPVPGASPVPLGSRRGAVPSRRAGPEERGPRRALVPAGSRGVTGLGLSALCLGNRGALLRKPACLRKAAAMPASGENMKCRYPSFSTGFLFSM